jgi:hypothetical protein
VSVRIDFEARVRSANFAASYWFSRVQRARPHHDDATRIAGEMTYRFWRLYMPGPARAFATGRIGIIQTLFSRNDVSGLSNLAAPGECVRRWPVASWWRIG